MMAGTTDHELRRIQREMAAEPRIESTVSTFPFPLLRRWGK
jgi:hypothetical protein